MRYRVLLKINCRHDVCVGVIVVVVAVVVNKVFLILVVEEGVLGTVQISAL